ncbi:hypothetical protein [Massilia genomosp. 1]|uniref:Uncharacterized protein n=1 Tax=Massilia genomosp. 1 TaxID=2609280 RepID=A0ABX0MS38_9BURK|nr:hypothetical protein [Massilia genomosp. 1]NHZ65564.1 hypothetical protein [Massilia genomosp. 1]
MAVVGLNMLAVAMMVPAGGMQAVSDAWEFLYVFSLVAPSIAVLVFYASYRMHLALTLLSILACIIMPGSARDSPAMGRGSFHVLVVYPACLMCGFILLDKAWRRITSRPDADQWRL